MTKANQNIMGIKTFGRHEALMKKKVPVMTIFFIGSKTQPLCHQILHIRQVKNNFDKKMLFRYKNTVSMPQLTQSKFFYKHAAEIYLTTLTDTETGRHSNFI